MELNKQFVDMAFWLSVDCAGVLLRDADIADIEHYFIYTAEDWAAKYAA